jgi:DNA-binding GntR family transcriptional regulator
MKLIPQQAIIDHDAILKAFIAKDAEALHKTILQSYEGWISMLNHKNQ